MSCAWSNKHIWRLQDKAGVCACHAAVGYLSSACGKAASNMWILPMQIDMLLPGLLGERDDFGERYCGHVREEVARGVYAWTGSSNLEELNAVLCQHLMIRRFKKDVLQDLPPKLRQRISISVAAKHSWVSLQRQMCLHGVTSGMMIGPSALCTSERQNRRL